MFVAAALVVAMVLYVNGHNTDSPTSTNPAAAVAANRDAEILIVQDQAPRSGHLARGQSPASGLERSVHARMAAEVKAGSINGPLHRARCRPAGSGLGPRRAFSCSIVAGGVIYPFLGVVDTAARQITYCKRDQPPVASHDIPVSVRCRA